MVWKKGGVEDFFFVLKDWKCHRDAYIIHVKQYVKLHKYIL